MAVVGVFDWGPTSLVMARGVLTVANAVDLHAAEPEPGAEGEMEIDHGKPRSRPSRAKVCWREKVLGRWPSIQNKTERFGLCLVSSTSVGVEFVVSFVLVFIFLRVFESRSCMISP